MAVVKNQHYVWRKYLAAWSDNAADVKKRRLYVLRKRPQGTQLQIEKALLVNVASEKFFYDISDHRNIDRQVMQKLLAHVQRSDKLKLEIDFKAMIEASSARDYVETTIMSPNENIDNEHHFLEKLEKGDVSFYKDSEAQQLVNILKKDMFNSLFELPVHYTDEELLRKFRHAVANCDKPDIKFEFNLFFWMQYFRSKKMHENQEAVIEEFKQKADLPQLDNSFYVNVILIFLAHKVAFNITQNIPSCLKLYRNHTDTPFVTADAPIVNLDYDESDDKTVSSRMYYPISPSVAVILQIGREVSENSVLELGQEDVRSVTDFNRCIFANAYNEVYSSEEGVLRALCTEIR